MVTTTDDKQFIGKILSETDQEITLEISGIRTPIPRSDIQQIQYAPALEDIYKQRRAQLESTDWRGYYDLAKWLFDNGRYAMAQKELRDLNARLTDGAAEQMRYELDLLERAVQFRIKIQEDAQRAKEKRAAETTAHADPGVDPTTAPSTSSPIETTTQNTTKSTAQKQSHRDAKPRLTVEEINTIRIYEQPEDLFESKPNIVIPPQVVESLYQRYGQDTRLPNTPKAFASLPGYEQLDLIFQLKAREMYSQIQVRDDPPAMTQFRRIHRSYVLNYCGSERCHGGGNETGSFAILRDQPEDITTAYTNFFLLHSTQVDNSELIDRDDPARSLLLQYGLPRDSAVFPHPDVPGWRPRLTNTTLPVYQMMEQWIASLWKPTPNYDITLQRQPQLAPHSSESSKKPAK